MKNKFRTARQLKKLKVIGATELLGISQPTLSAWETGNKAPLTFPKENKIENTFPPKMPPTTYINKPTYNDTLQAFTGGDIINER